MKAEKIVVSFLCFADSETDEKYGVRFSKLTYY
jgi:hypothetical protein